MQTVQENTARLQTISPSERQVPNDLEKEKSILSALILYPEETVPDVVDSLVEDDFYKKLHANVFRAIMDLHYSKEAIDYISVKSWLVDKGLIKSERQGDYVLNLISHPVPSNTPSYIKSIQAKRINRNLIYSLNGIIHKAYSGEDVLDEAQQQINALEYPADHKAKPLKQILHEAVERYEERKLNGGITGIPYGFKDLDYHTCGMQPQDLIIIAGRPGMGKSVFIHQVAIRSKVPVIIYSLEMSKEQVSDRLISSVSKINSTRLRTGEIPQQRWLDIIKAASKLSEKPVFIDDSVNITVEEISRRTRQLVRKEGVKICFVDYTQLLSVSKKSERRDLDIGHITRRLKLMARELKIPVVLLAQLNRNLENRNDKRPKLSDLRESGSLEQDADVVLLLYRDIVYNEKTTEPHVVEIDIAKQRMGPTVPVKLYWDSKTTTIENLSRG